MYFVKILIFLTMMVWQDADSFSPSGVKRRRSAPKSDTSPVRARGIQAGDDLTLLTMSNQHGGIMHALQPGAAKPKSLTTLLVKLRASQGMLLGPIVLRWQI